LANHPDKVPEDERSAADTKFKAVSEAYEILYDDDKRHLYDTHGMGAFEKAAGNPGGMHADVDMEDILQQMFGMGMGGGGMPGPGGAGVRRSRRGEDEEQEYEVTLEELYKGKTTKFASTKKIVCSHCKGTGGKEKATAKSCDTCKGKGVCEKLKQVGPGLVTPVAVLCATCNGAGKFYKDKDRCKKCKGARVVQQKKMLELYIPPGSREGERIVLKGEADQYPDQEPGDIVFVLSEMPHKTFRRAGADLAASVEITLAEALIGFNRVVITHLDGRGLQINTTQSKGKILRPDQVLKVQGEGMPVKRTDTKGDLFLVVDVKFPADGWIQDPESITKLQSLLPNPAPLIETEEVDEVSHDPGATIEEFGAGSGDPRAGAEWEDEEEQGQGAQCAQQ